MAEDQKVDNNAGKPVDKKNWVIEIAALIVLVAGIVWIGSLIFDFSGTVKTNNAQVDGGMAAVTARVTGNIKEIRFSAYSLVQAGDTLVLLDDAEFKIKLAQAQADLDVAMANLLVMEQAAITSKSTQEAFSSKHKGYEANLEKAEKNFSRYENMYADSAVTRNQFDQVIAQLKSDQAFLEASENDVLANKSSTKQNIINIEASKATVNRKKADLDAARLQLSYTIITAPVAGIIGERTLEIGELVNNNQVLASIVHQDDKWVSANFKETQMEEIKVGQKVEIMVAALGGKSFPGVVKDLSPATGAKFSMVAPDNSTGHFVKITQRIPVRIEFTDSPDKLDDIKPGMNVSVEINK